MSDAADGAVSRGSADNNVVWFLYTGQGMHLIPRDVTHLRIAPSVKVVGRWAFSNCKNLVAVELCKGVEWIESGAFSGCESLQRFKVPSSVRVICAGAFRDCIQLVDVELCEGLQRIDINAFTGCKSLKYIRTPSTVTLIASGAFHNCNQFIDV